MVGIVIKNPNIFSTKSMDTRAIFEVIHFERVFGFPANKEKFDKLGKLVLMHSSNRNSF